MNLCSIEEETCFKVCIISAIIESAGVKRSCLPGPPPGWLKNSGGTQNGRIYYLWHLRVCVKFFYSYLIDLIGMNFYLSTSVYK